MSILEDKSWQLVALAKGRENLSVYISTANGCSGWTDDYCIFDAMEDMDSYNNRISALMKDMTESEINLAKHITSAPIY